MDRNLAVMWATEPFRTYRSYINVYAVEIASIDYGVRCDPDGRVRHPDGTIRDTGQREGPIDTKNTALRMIFQNGCNDPLARGTVYGGAPVDCASYADYYPPGVNPCETGNQAHNRILDTYVMPVLGIPRTSQNVQTLAIFNTFTYGGIGGTNATTSGGSPQGPLISLHELGHSLGTMADEYPYSSRDVVRPCYTGGEPGSFHHTIYTDPAQMVADQHKWWRWVGEESLSGGTIGLHEGGGTFPCGQRRPSEHSIMRWIGFDWDQVGREHMVARITGMRNAGQMSMRNTPLGTVAADSVLWVETGHPRYHELQRDLADRRGGRHRPGHARQPEPRPRPARPARRHGRPRRGARPRRAGRDRLGAQPVDRQHRHELRLQRPPVRTDSRVDGRRPRRGAVTAGRRDHRLDDDQPAGRR